MVLMIIKRLFRRYERWNPVHPTTGAFWGMGLRIGCGVIGYVGAGCGVGFSVCTIFLVLALVFMLFPSISFLNLHMKVHFSSS
ncbi:hypothetical protein MKW92_025679, partial [Papaver armeniacum]